MITEFNDYQYDFVSSEEIISQVKEELRSYFQTGVIDDVLFPRYISSCLKKMGDAVFKKEKNIFYVENYSFNLPENFKNERDLILVTPQNATYKIPSGSLFEQKTYSITPIDNKDIGCGNSLCIPKEINVTYKTDTSVTQSFICRERLHSGEVYTNSMMAGMIDNNNLNNSMYTYKKIDNKILLYFQTAYVYMLYYAIDYDINGFLMIPDNERIIQYISSYLKYKCFETIYNNVTDETYKQVESKFIFYRGEMYDNKAIAETEIRLQSRKKIVNSINRTRRRFIGYSIQ